MFDIDFAKTLKALYYKGWTPEMPVSLLMEAGKAARACIEDRAWRQEQTFVPYVGLYDPYVRPSWSQHVYIWVKERSRYEKVYRQYPARQMLAFRSAAIDPLLRDLAVFGVFSGVPEAYCEGVYRKGQDEVRAAVRDVLSSWSRGRGVPGLFVEKGGAAVASDLFVDGFFLRVAARWASLVLSSWAIPKYAAWADVKNPVTGAVVRRVVPVRMPIGGVFLGRVE